MSICKYSGKGFLLYKIKNIKQMNKYKPSNIQEASTDKITLSLEQFLFFPFPFKSERIYHRQNYSFGKICLFLHSLFFKCLKGTIM